MKHHFNCAWICAVLPHCRGREPVRQGTVVLSAKQSESQSSESSKSHSRAIFPFPLRFEYSLTIVTKYNINSLVWVKPRRNKSPCETCQPIWRINPALCQGVPLWIGSFLSADNTSVGHQHFPEDVFRGEEVCGWREMVCKRNGTWSLTWALLPAQAPALLQHLLWQQSGTAGTADDFSRLFEVHQSDP